MSETRHYGDAVARSHGLRGAPALVATVAEDTRMAVTKISIPAGQVGLRNPVPPQDALVAALFLRDLPYNELWKRGRPYLRQGYAADSLRIVDLEHELSSYVAHPQAALSFYIPRRSFALLTQDGGRLPASLCCEPGIADPVMAHLGHSLIPALDRPAEAASLFVEHVFLAILSHLAHRYGNVGAAKPLRHGGLSTPQERRATDYLASHFDRDMSLAEVAQACGLSRSYFIRAFRQATGMTPHRWVQRYRIARAKEMLRVGKMTLADIAAGCGFADQSHFTRVFGKLEGISPGTWRRQRAD
jgi:AraC family transcriptional regulator